MKEDKIIISMPGASMYTIRQFQALYLRTENKPMVINQEIKIHLLKEGLPVEVINTTIEESKEFVSKQKIREVIKESSWDESRKGDVIIDANLFIKKLGLEE